MTPLYQMGNDATGNKDIARNKRGYPLSMRKIKNESMGPADLLTSKEKAEFSLHITSDGA